MRTLRLAGAGLALHSILAIGVSACSDASSVPDPTPCRTEPTEAISDGGLEQFGVPVTPAVYLINFLFLYMANPEHAADMPAFMAPLPGELATCLRSNPAGCPREEYERFFERDDADGADHARCACEWQPDCQLPDFEGLAPRRYQLPEQINQPLGLARAEEIAHRLGVGPDMILSDEEYRCVIGTEPRTETQEIIFECVADLTNSIGNAEIPLSSYGLDVSPDGLLRSNCAPEAPCLEFNELLTGPLEQLLAECGAEEKFLALVARTPFLEFGALGNECQSDSKPACIVDAHCSRATR